MRGVAADVSNDRCSSLGHESDERRATAREMVGKETADLLGRQQRLSVRDLASKFESGQAAAHAAAARLAQEVGSIIMSSSPLHTHKTTKNNKNSPISNNFLQFSLLPSVAACVQPEEGQAWTILAVIVRSCES